LPGVAFRSLRPHTFIMNAMFATSGRHAALGGRAAHATYALGQAFTRTGQFDKAAGFG